MPRFTAKVETWATTDPFVPAVISEADFRLVVVDGVMGFLPRMDKNEWTYNNVCCVAHVSIPLIFWSVVQTFRLRLWLLL